MKNGLEDKYIIKNNKKLYFGYTTGSCAAAATKAATIMLFTGKKVESIQLMTPKGIMLTLSVLEIQITKDYVKCAVKKFSGDDPDVTDGIMVYSKVSKNSENTFFIDGGVGVGRVTKKGLEQPVGNAAINRVPREMILNCVKEVIHDFEYFGGIDVEISIPEGVEIARKTFNPRLGIEGGISVLGTSGIVEPMSEAALIDSIRFEMKMRVAQGSEYLIITPGNYGSGFTLENFDVDEKFLVKCSNYIGEAIDIALELGVKGILFISHIGKFIKIAGGIMNTHSSFADSRMEIFMANAINAGADLEIAKEILKCGTTDEAISMIKDTEIYEATFENIIGKVKYYIDKRAQEEIDISLIVFSNEYGELGRTKNVDEILSRIKEKN